MTTKTIEKDFTTTIVVDEMPKAVFDAVNNVRGWWSQEIEGDTDRLNSEFRYHYRDVHICKMRIVEFIPEKKVVWLVLENHFNFIKDQREWVGTKVIFEISRKGDKTELHFTHQGLVPDYECFDICFKAWTQYIQESLVSLITTGKGQPNPKEGKV
jgi:hypothetical protein